jgi:hypothetical protein
VAIRLAIIAYAMGDALVYESRDVALAEICIDESFKLIDVVNGLEVCGPRWE